MNQPQTPSGGDESVEVAHLYVHAPFCARRCFYCDFAVDVRRSAEPYEWAEVVGLERALVERTGRARLGPALKTLYVGGGTPSLLGPDAMDALGRALGSHRLRHPELEWTAEANPESLTPEVARGWRRAGVGRLSLGVQSFQETVLRWMGRLHGGGGAARAVAVARDAGITNLSVDLIFGLPDGLPRDWGRDLDAAIALDVPHISLYGLTAEPGTGLGRGVAGGRIRMADEDSYADEYLQAHHRLVAAGYRHYEVSNFARPGFESRHNRAYWTGVPYLGFGNSAHSFLPPVRLGNLRDWGEYVKSVRAGRTPWSMRDLPSVSGLRLEGLWLGLRSDLGLPRSALPPAACRRAREWIRRGLAVPDPERVRLTASGWLVLDALALELDGILEAGAPG